MRSTHRTREEINTIRYGFVLRLALRLASSSFLFLLLCAVVVPKAAPRGVDRAEFAYVASGYNPAIMDFNLATRRSRSLSYWDLGTDLPAWSPDGKRIAYIGYNGTTSAPFVSSVDGAEWEWAVMSPEHETNPVWSGDGQWLVSPIEDMGYYGSALLVSQLDGNEGHIIEMGDTYVDYPAPSPDGKQLVFLVYDDPEWSLWIDGIDQPTSQARLLIRAVDGITPAWSPDSRWLVYSDSHPWEQQRASLYALEVATGRKVALASGLNGVWTPLWSPDGHFLALGYAGGPQIHLTGRGSYEAFSYPKTSLYWLDVACLQASQLCSNPPVFLDWDVDLSDSLSWLPGRNWLAYHYDNHYDKYNFHDLSVLHLVDVACEAASTDRCSDIVVALPEDAIDSPHVVWRPNYP